MLNKATRKTLLIILPLFMGAAIVFVPSVPRELQPFWLAGCALLLGYGIHQARTPRPCGHGTIAQDRYGISYPYVIKQFPTCGEIYK